MALAGHGVAWLPESLIVRELAGGGLIDLGNHVPMEIRLYRSTDRSRQLIEQVWTLAAGTPALDSIPAN